MGHAQGRRAPQELRSSLGLLHSYVLVRGLAAAGDHLGAARSLTRVSTHISRFPAHAAQILTSAVIECQRAGLPRTARDHAQMLMSPEYRANIAEQYRKKVEAIVRKPDRSEEPDMEQLPCPACAVPGDAYDLSCASCAAQIPYCIATGKRMELQGWSECPGCHFPANGNSLLTWLEHQKVCRMCQQLQALSAIAPVADPIAVLKAY